MPRFEVESETKRKFKPYVPTRIEKAIDSVFRTLAPRLQAKRTAARHQEYMFRYLSGVSTTARQNASPLTSGESLRGSREKMQVMWNAIDLIENSGLCSSILEKIGNYICGTIKYQARTGNRGLNRLIQQYMRDRSGKGLDLAGRNTLRQIGKMAVRSIFLKGDAGINMPNIGGRIYLQGIEGDRIGDPYDYRINNEFVRGIHLNEAGAIESFDVFVRDRMSSRYVFDKNLPARDEFGMPCFLFSSNRISFDDVRGVSIFNTCINNADYIMKMREYELMAMLWGSSMSGVYNTESGMLPPGNPFDNPQTVNPIGGGSFETVQIKPNQVTALGIGEKVTMFDNNRPNPAVIPMYNNTIRDIACGVKLSYGFVWDMSGVPNPAVRYMSGQDKRQIQSWQDDIHEDLLEPIKNMLIMNGMADGDLPYHPRILDGVFVFPPHPTIDAGRESDKDINEINAGVNSGTRVCLENGDEQEEVTDELSHEVAYRIRKAKEVAEAEGVDFREVLGMMRQVNGETRQAPAIEAAQAASQAANALKNAAQADADPGKAGATDDGEPIQ